MPPNIPYSDPTATVPPGQTPTSSLVDKLRAIAARAEAAKQSGGWSAVLPLARDTAHTTLGALPDWGGISDRVGDAFDLAYDSAAAFPDPAKMKTQALAVGHGVEQGATGFNEGLASTVGRALDVLPYFASRAMGGEGVHPVEGTFRKYFVDPAGPPTTPKQRILRAGGNMVGENLPTILSGGGLAASGIRSGVTFARQAAGGVLDGVVAPALASATEAPAASSVADRLRALAARAVPDVVNGLRPANIVNAVRPANLQGSADLALNVMAKAPVEVTGLQAYRSFRKGESAERARQAGQQPSSAQPDPNSIVPPSLDYNYSQF